MADVSISEAIALFDHSNTARGANGSVGTYPLLVIERLRYLHAIDEIGFVTPEDKKKRATQRGSYAEDRAGVDLRLNPSYVKRLPESERLAAVSLLLVHEGVHALLDWRKDRRLYEELMARKVPIYYYRELAGPGVLNVTTGTKVTLGSNAVTHLQQQSHYLDRDQLLDFTIDIATYQKDSYLDKKWIKDNLGLWGGLRNRWPSTRRLFVEKLLPSASDPYYGVAILEILESVESRQEWEPMIETIKKKSQSNSLRPLQIGFESLLGNKSLSGRIAALQRKWGTQLTELP
jgi:hypothetical protein